MHANNIIHRDLKLANLLVTEDFQIKITDFGLSLHWYEGIVCHHFKGNVKYSSPEILRARADKNITIYAYCVRAADHQILTNRGYMFLDDVEAHVVCDAAGRVVDWRGLQVATYDARRNALVFATPRGLVRNERSGSFIEFTAAGSAAMWSEGADRRKATEKTSCADATDTSRRIDCAQCDDDASNVMPTSSKSAPTTPSLSTRSSASAPVAACRRRAS